MFRKGHRGISRKFGEQNFLSKIVEVARQSMLYCFYLSIGYDRYRRYLLGKQDAKSGSIVIFDRFPLQFPLDGPKIQLAASGQKDSLASFFSRLEERLYRKFEMPDHLILLEVSPGESLRRKPDHQPDAIHAKNVALRTLWADPESDHLKLDWLLLNANLPREDVLNKLKKVIWAAALPNHHDY
jgi:hypothetical protein